MIDMHLHTYYSDGTMSPTEIVKRAADRGVKTIAITDHDGLNGIEEALEAGKRYGIKVIPGIELSANLFIDELGLNSEYSFNVINMHILGYEIDISDADLKEAVGKMRERREDRNRRLLSALNDIGLDIDEEDLIQRSGQDYIGKPNFAFALVNKGYIESIKEASTPGKFLRHPKARQVYREKIHVREAIELIKNAGGYSVLAHPMKVIFPEPLNTDKFQSLELLLNRLVKWGLSGMECYYSTHTKEQTSLLVGMAKNREIKITAGSDFHGPDFDPGIDIGVTGLSE
ncbi:MAG TPA: PHP domain-containing protein [Anaerovoracaceae bacterium]|nr:PHP domain-containing protein [Anaerovoracaceae bacterium]